ncbi:MAG: hypothetical protein OK455_09990 [Thaumarchaeota archaeon]|nr:hypothetical protein [Nitrososphaerota archaeon]
MTTLNTAFTRVVTEKLVPQVEVNASNELARKLKEIGESTAVKRFLNCYGKVRVRSIYAVHLANYFRWLREKKGVVLRPDELIVDNLRCTFRSEPEDVGTRRKHRAWLEEYVNEEMEGKSESYRRLAASAVKSFYERNDSPLNGKVNIAERPPPSPSRTPKAEDIRKVLLALPLQARTPLLCEWQSGVEINRLLGLRWRDVAEGLERGDCPVKLEFTGRKGHRRGYCSFLGRDSIKHLKLVRGMWTEAMGSDPQPDDIVFLGKRKSGMDYGWLNQQLKTTAMRLGRQGLIESKDPRSWHSHAQALVQVGGGAREGPQRAGGVHDGAQQRDWLGLRQQGPGAPGGLC